MQPLSWCLLLQAAKLPSWRYPQEAPAPGPGARFLRSGIANPAAVPLCFQLLQRAALQDQLWGLAAWRELLLQVGRWTIRWSGLLTVWNYKLDPTFHA